MLSTRTGTASGLFGEYAITGFDEMFAAPGVVRPHYATLHERLSALGADEIERRHRVADLMMRQQGITFTVYGREQGVERIIPFDPIPRLIAVEEWERIERGLKQRVRALNLFLHDVYHDRLILKDNILPAELVLGASGYRRECVGIRVPRDIYLHINGIDLIRDARGNYLVLEDNGRTASSGVSYVLENRQVMKRVLPLPVPGSTDVRAIEDLRRTTCWRTLQQRRPEPRDCDDPTIVILTPGIYNSGLLRAQLPRPPDGRRARRGPRPAWSTTGSDLRCGRRRGRRRVDVIYRRVDDDFLDPLAFRRDSMLGVAGLVGAHRAGRVGLANAIGTGVADDKGIYPFVPDIIKYYLREDPIIENVETFRPLIPAHRQHILANLDKLVVKPVDSSGGYGMLIGPASTAEQREEFARKVEANPRGFIAQPTISLSQHPTFVDGQIEGRHVDLRPFVLYGREISVLPGGLTRVALPRGSLVVNSSQGGGTKDTWVLRSPPTPPPAPRIEAP